MDNQKPLKQLISEADAIEVRAADARVAKLFRDNRSQAVRIPAEFELPGDRALIRREGAKLIIEPVAEVSNIVELMAQWKKEEPLGPEDQFPDITNMPATPEGFL